MNEVGSQITPTTFRDVLSISEDEFEEMGRVGAMFFEQGNTHKALSIFEGLAELEPESADAHAALGCVLAMNQQDREALDHLNTAIELDPTQIAPYVSIAEIHLRRLELEEAIAALGKAIELDPEQKDRGANRARAIVLGIERAIRFNSRFDS
ncbi:MAG: tetratricopeptide repeat protein [Pyrinomonadaceae bacterium]